MTQAIREYLLSIVAAALLTSILLAIVPNGTIRKVGSIAAGLFLIVVCLSPIHAMDFNDLSRSICRSVLQEHAALSGIEVRNLDLTAELIKQNTQAYILDKAASLGAELTVEVSVCVDGSYPFPNAVVLRGSITKQQKECLSEYIEANLAISEQSQEWIVE